MVLCLQDTTELDYNGQAMSGLGPLSYEVGPAEILNSLQAVVFGGNLHHEIPEKLKCW